MFNNDTFGRYAEPIKQTFLDEPVDGNDSWNTAEKQFIEMRGEVLESLPSGSFRVKLENDQEVIGHLAGKLRKNRIRVLPGDDVKVEISPYDLTKARITFRF